METQEVKTSSPVVIRVSVKSTSTKTPAKDEEILLEETNSITLDTFMCGFCQLECVDITEFLGHRLQHKFRQDAYRCELCKATFSNQEDTVDHYLHDHKVDVTTHQKRPVDASNQVLARIDGIPVNETTVSNDQIQTIIGEENCQETDNVSKLKKETVDISTEQIPAIDDEEDDEQDENQIDVQSEAVQMLKFRLRKEDVQGVKFNYGRNVYCCVECNYSFCALLTLISHMHKRHPEVFGQDGGQECYEDDESVLTVGEYYTTHAKKKEEEQTLSKLTRGRNRKKQDQRRIYTCQVCQKVFQKTRSLRLHMEIHRTERNYLCDECGKAFKSQIRLNAHRKVHREKLFQCSQCDFQSSVNSAIHVHRQYHRDGCVLCHVCGAAYTDKSTLKKHMQVHSIDRPFGCAFEGCTWRFKTQAMCKAHLRAHTTKGKFKCDICGYMFRHKHHLQRHQTSMHGVNTSDQITAAPSTPPKQVESSVSLPVHSTDGETSIQVVPVQVVVATDMQGTPITYEQSGAMVEVNQLNAGSYNQVLIQTSEHSQIFATTQE
ncbi:uncharacterized protein [Amphiura filiformis]|uniref:uncharacterized protein n=1 Tax=Amphiura filiformis TaxID=82378 RepID=UPI003B225682